MKGALLALFVLVFAPFATLRAEQTLVLKDATGAVIGEVLDVTNGRAEAPVTVIYRLATGDFALLKADQNSVGYNGIIRFETTDCSGTPYVYDTLAIPSPITQWAFVVGVTEGGLTIFKYDPTATPALHSFHSYFGVDGTCQQADIADTAIPGQAVEPFPSFVAPFSLDLNPVLFHDGFRSGDTARWSRAIP